MRRSAALEPGCGAGGRNPAIHLVDAETDDEVAGFRHRRRLQAADRGRAAADQAPDVTVVARRIRLRAADGADDVAVGKLEIRPAQSCHVATAQRPVKEQRDDRAVDEAATLGRLGALESASGTARSEAGSEHGGALLGGETAGSAAPGRDIGGRGAPEALEGLPGQRAGRWLFADIAGGTPHGGYYQGGGRRGPAGLVEMSQVRGEARILDALVPAAGRPYYVVRTKLDTLKLLESTSPPRTRTKSKVAAALCGSDDSGGMRTETPSTLLGVGGRSPPAASGTRETAPSTRGLCPAAASSGRRRTPWSGRAGRPEPPSPRRPPPRRGQPRRRARPGASVAAPPRGGPTQSHDQDHQRHSAPVTTHRCRAACICSPQITTDSRAAAITFLPSLPRAPPPPTAPRGSTPGVDVAAARDEHLR